MSKILAFVINVDNSPDGLQAILNEFEERSEFDVSIVDPLRHVDPDLSLLFTIQHILQSLPAIHPEYILICDNTHRFTDNYHATDYLNVIEESKRFNADILLGNVNTYEIALELSEHLFWIDGFSAFQFAIIFRKCFDALQGFNAVDNGNTKEAITGLHLNKLLISPRVSYKREQNPDIFQHLKALRYMSRFYKMAVKKLSLSKNKNDLSEFSIPTYLINLPERTDRRTSIEQEFADKPEFDLTIVEAVKHERGNVGLWLSIRKVIQMAIENEDDLIIICEDDHVFTQYYRKEIFLRTVSDAFNLGADLLSGGVGSFDIGLPVTDAAWWINSFSCTQFIVLYKPIFSKILQVQIDDNILADWALSVIAKQKITMVPFISVQKNFGYSDISPRDFQLLGPTIFLFDATHKRLETYNKVVRFYNLI